MNIIGLTGSIGMGKSGVATMLRALRIPVFDADKIIHKLYDDPVVARVLALTFPGAVKSGKIDRKRLSDIVFDNPELRQRLSSILYPALAVEEQHFLRQAARRNAKTVILDIPLLYETGAVARTDAAIVADAPPYVQRYRVLHRPGMTAEKLATVLSLQLPNRMKCQMADAVICTGWHRGMTLRQLKRKLVLLQQKLASRPRVWDTFTYARNRRRY